MIPVRLGLRKGKDVLPSFTRSSVGSFTLEFILFWEKKAETVQKADHIKCQRKAVNEGSREKTIIKSRVLNSIRLTFKYKTVSKCIRLNTITRPKIYSEYLPRFSGAPGPSLEHATGLDEVVPVKGEGVFRVVKRGVLKKV